MKFLAITLIPYAPDPVTGVLATTTDRLRSVVNNAVLAEELGFDGYGAVSGMSGPSSHRHHQSC